MGYSSGGFVALPILGTPTAPRLILPSWNGDTFSFRLLGDDSQDYTIEFSDDLGFWNFLGEARLAGGFVDVTDPSAFSSARVYRAYAP